MSISTISASQLTWGRWAFAFALITSLFFIWGFAFGLLGVLNAHFQGVFGIDKTQSTLLQVAHFGAYLVFSPFAGIFMKKRGYKAGIHVGLALYSLGAILFWPSAKFAKYGGFVGASFVMGGGLAILEVAANSYIYVLGSPKYAAARLTFSQGFQGVATFAGPFIASRWFFLGANATKLATVQWVYVAVAALGLVLNVLFYFCNLPEIKESSYVVDRDQKVEPFWRQWRCIFGFVAQTVSVGAGISGGSLAINFMVEQGIGINASKASQLLSFCEITSTLAKFFGVAILNFVDPALMFTFYGINCCIFSACIALATGKAAIGSLFALSFFQSICYSCIFSLGTKNLGVHTKLGAGLIIMGVNGGAWYPPAQAALADRVSTRRSYLVPFSGYIIMTLYAIGILINQIRKDGFRFRNIDEVYHPSANTSSEEDPRVRSIPELRQEEEFEELQKDKHLIPAATTI